MVGVLLGKLTCLFVNYIIVHRNMIKIRGRKEPSHDNHSLGN